MIANTGCQVKWNPDFFEDKEPYKMTQVSFSFRSILMLRNSLGGLCGIGLELWSMSDSIYFDNLLIVGSI